MAGQPRIRRNDHGVLQPPALGQWKPELPVSVVIPAHAGQDKLDITLASLAAQSYPAHLLEVIVVDDASDPPLRLPEIAPIDTRIVPSAAGGWGSGHAFHSGVLQADGEIILRLDADMLVYREHVEAQARWHHLADYLLVLGGKRFTEYATGDLSPQRAFDAVVADAGDDLFDYESSRRDWVEDIFDKYDELRTATHRMFTVAVGATLSLSPRLYHAAGGMDTDLILGGDTEFGYRAAQAGAVFVPERQAKSWHLGMSAMIRQRDDGARFREPSIANRVPLLRDRRKDPGRQWLVPYIDVVVDGRDRSYEDARATVDGVLASSLHDLRVSLIGPWSSLTEERRGLLDDPLLDARLMCERYRHEGRVQLVESVPETAAPTPFRFICPAGWVPTPGGLHKLVKLADEHYYGLISLALPGQVDDRALARLERTASFARAVALRAPDEDLDGLVDELFGSHWLDGTEWTLVPAADVPPPTWPNDWKGEAQRWRAEAEKWKREAATLKKRARGAQPKQQPAAAPSPALRGARRVRRLARLVGRPK
ncbi:glycosyltransferase [Actinomadura alba]|uniref:Glycosyltransferase family 2 protein n=1 Tax=Actinomadura alba TaxID=406431 RepID=A0ABR7LJ36_9ACTN|nr:glycosyltransferase family A protein [Actinomadura alba]MBC6464798.1 glycosyltransferase family 2 protein [Actinomadura alba]